MVLACLVLFETGCKKSEPPQALSLEKAPSALTEAFVTAKPEIKGMVNEITAALQNKDYPKAHTELQGLCAVPELTAKQRTVAAACVLTVSEQLQTAQAQGDQKAAEVIKTYQMNK